MGYTLNLELLNPDGSVDCLWTLLKLEDKEAQLVLDSGVTVEVTRALWRKQIAGVREHGFAMQPGDDVDAILNAFEEALDLSQYLMKMIEERSHD